MKRLLIILLITLFAPAQLPALSSFDFGNFDDIMCTSSKDMYFAKTDFSKYPQICQDKITNWVNNKQSPVEKPTICKCNGKPFECNAGDIYSECCPCFYLLYDSIIDLNNKYAELACKKYGKKEETAQQKQQLAEEVCKTEIPDIKPTVRTNQQQELIPQSIAAPVYNDDEELVAIETEYNEAPVFNNTNTASAFSNTPSMMSTDAAEQKKFKEEIENPSKRIKQQDIQKIEQKKVSITDDTKFTPTKKDASPVKSDDSGTTITVLNEKNKPLNGVKVCYNKTCLETSAKGTVYFDDVIDSTADLTIQSDAYKQKTIKRTKSTDKSSEFTITCIKNKNEAIITIVNLYDSSEKFSNVKICTDKNNKSCKKTDMYGTATFTNGQTIYIDQENYECTPQIATINDNETITCKKPCSEKELKKLNTGLKEQNQIKSCYKNKKGYEIAKCAYSDSKPDNGSCKLYKNNIIISGKDIDINNVKISLGKTKSDFTPAKETTVDDPIITIKDIRLDETKYISATHNNDTVVCEFKFPNNTKCDFDLLSGQEKCIKQEITKEQYEKLESEIDKIIEETKKTIESQCSSENEVLHKGCKQKDDLITQFEKLKKDTLNELKELSRTQCE